MARTTRPAPPKPPGTKPKPDHPRGINVHLAMEWLLRTIFGPLRQPLAKEAPPSEPSTDPGHFHGGSPNMKLLYTLIWYAWAWLADPASMPVARERARRILARERECWGQGEPTTSSHLQLWLAGVAGILYVAERAEHAELVELARWWLQIAHAVHAATLVERPLGQFHRDDAGWQETYGKQGDGGAMWCPGGRGTTHPKNSAKGWVPLGANESTPRMWDAYEGRVPDGKPNQFDLGAWLLSRCTDESREAIRRWPDEFPPTAGPLHVRRYADGDFVAWYDRLDGVSDTTLSAGVLDGVPWVAELIDQARLDAYEGRSPVLTIDTVEADPKWRVGRADEADDDE